MRDITVSVAVLTIPSDFTWSSMRMVRLYRSVECEVPQGCSDNGAGIDHTGQSNKTGAESGVYQCGDY